MEFLAQQINPPASWETFEELCRALFAAIWNDPLAQRHGRSGQVQHGVDIHGARPDCPGETLGVQCKGKDRNFGKKATTREFDAELAKAEGFVPTLSGWTFATTFADDAKLQAHALAVSRQRIAAGKFPVNALGWNSLVSQLAQHPAVIEQFYPGLGVQLPQLMATLAALPDRVIGALGTAPPDQAQEAWIEERFDQARDLGPALLGRPLGAADVSACAELPQVDRLWRELEAGFSARLVATAGAGKSVCALQLAKRAHDKGWRVLRLKDSAVGALALAPGDQPTLHIIDDAHLTDPQLLRRAEEAAGATQWLLSAHTIADDKAPLPGAIRIDPEQAVAVIAAGLRAGLPTTARIVKRIDDRIGDAIGDEAIEDRLAAAATAQRPWQFCFILGGGWRRAQQSAEDARAADADLVLAAAAIRQLATRDARAQPDDLTGLFDAGGIAAQQRLQATTWLIERRLLLAEDDLRCPHQRLATVLIARVLEGQTKEGRAAIGAMVDHVIAAGTYPLSGISALLTELRMMGNFPTRWTHLVDRSRLPALIARCWGAESPEARRGAAWLLSELQSYVDDWAATISQGYAQVAADWFSAPLPGTGYGIGHLIGQIGMKDAALAQGVIALADPVRVAAAVSQGDAVLACEAAGMVSSCMRHRPDSWRTRYLAAIDRDACVATMRSWPRDHYLSAAGSFCELFTWDDEAFGLDLIEALLPAIGEEVRARPFHSFHELHDMVWHALRMSDTLGIYAGKKGPTARMRAVAAQLAACWRPEELAAQVSAINRRDFQTAAWLLGFIGEVSKRQFEATVAHIDWARIDRTIGDAWGAMYHEVAIFLQVAFHAGSAKASIRAMIAAHLDEMEPLSVRLAMLAPETAARQVTAGKTVGLASHGHFHWRMSAAVVAQLVNPHPDLLEPMIAPHVAAASAQLGRKTQPFFDKPLLFLRLARQMAPVGFERIMAGIDPDGAEAGWTAALQGADARQHAPTGDRRQRRADRESAAWLVEGALERDDALGEVARRVRARFPRRSLPPAKLLQPFT
ncbi:MAG: hypothetical protein B7Y97_02715 [Sphingomonas sp. 32-66-10]|nr:MAG: hypothetical protein B7Y97_02715 [Sphingomonas sp. 32-66-10]